jgi:ATP-binding cassette, subfamily C, bacterial
MWQVLNIFFRADGARPIAVLVCLIVGGMLEAVGVGTLLPALNTALNASAAASPLEIHMQAALNWIGLTSSFGLLLAIAVGLFILRSLILFGAMTYAGIAGARVSNTLRKRLIKAVFDARWSYYADQSSGRIANVLSVDATRSADAYNLCALALANLAQIAGYSTVALLINWKVAIFALAGGAFISLVSSQIIKRSWKAGRKQVDRTATLTSDMVDLVQNIKALKAMHRYDPMIESLTSIIKRLRRTLYTQYVLRFGLVYGIDILMVSILAVAGWLAISAGQVPVEQIVVIGILFFQVMSYISKFLKQLQAAKTVEAAYTSTLAMISDAERQKEAAFGALPPPAKADVHFDGISFAHGEKSVLHRVSLIIPGNRITVLQGPSGAGKTTLIDLLIGLHRPSAGRIRLGSQDLQDTDIIAWRRKIGYVPQELALFHDSIRENISLSEPGIADSDIQAALELAGAGGFIASLPAGLDTDVGEFGGKLSGGQRQRISLARALVRKPEILVLDEVTSALDPDTEAAIVDNIARLRGAYTIIAITHRPAWTGIADELYSFDGGRVTVAKGIKGKRVHA